MPLSESASRGLITWSLATYSSSGPPTILGPSRLAIDGPCNPFPPGEGGRGEWAAVTPFEPRNWLLGSVVGSWAPLDEVRVAVSLDRLGLGCGVEDLGSRASGLRWGLGVGRGKVFGCGAERSLLGVRLLGFALSISFVGPGCGV